MDFKRGKILIVFTLMLLLMVGCSENKDNIKEEIEETKMIVDCYDREVEVPEEPERIGILYAYAGHVATLLDAQEQIVCVVEGLKRDIMMQEKVPNIEELSVPFNAGVINIEELIKSNPDVVFVRKSTASNEAEVEKLEKAGIPFVVVDYSNIEEQKDSIRVMGEVLNKTEEANEYIEFYEEIISTVKDRTSSISDKEKVKVYHSVNEAVRTDAKGSIGDEITTIAGITNVSTGSELKLDEEKSYCTLEQIYEWNPEAIIVNDISVKEYMLSDSKWEGLKAVELKEIYPLPVGMSRWGHPGSLETPMAIMYISQLFYPDLYEYISMKDLTKDYYQNFFDVSLSDEEVVNILNSKGMRIPKEN